MKKFALPKVASILLLFMLVAVIVPMPPAQAQTMTTYSLPSGTPTPWQMEIDGNYIWFSGSTSTEGYLVRVDTTKVATDPAGATQWWEVAPSYHAETGSAYAGASVGVAIGGGYIWSGGQYSGSDTQKTELLSRFNPTTYEVTYYWLPVEAKGIRAIRYSDGIIWICANRLLKFDVATGTITGYSDPIGAYDLLVDGSTLWVSSSSKGIVKFDASRLDTYTTYQPSSPPALLTKDSSGNIWFSMNNANKIGKLSNGVITEYSLNIPTKPDGTLYDSPYGLVFDNYGKLWIAGYEYKKMIQFDPSTGTVLKTLDSTNKPYYPAKHSSGNIWCWGQGSIDLNVINPTETTTTTTTETGGGGGASIEKISLRVTAAEPSELLTNKTLTVDYDTALTFTLKAQKIYDDGTKKPLSNNPVSCYVKPTTGSEIITRKKTADNGYVAFTIEPQSTGAYEIWFETSYTKSGTTYKAKTDVFTVTWKPQKSTSPTIQLPSTPILLASFLLIILCTLGFIGFRRWWIRHQRREEIKPKVALY
jgi:streptogramin lyase